MRKYTICTLYKILWNLNDESRKGEQGGTCSTDVEIACAEHFRPKSSGEEITLES
jgi:hypothetical protein